MENQFFFFFFFFFKSLEKVGIWSRGYDLPGMENHEDTEAGQRLWHTSLSRSRCVAQKMWARRQNLHQEFAQQTPN